MGIFRGLFAKQKSAKTEGNKIKEDTFTVSKSLSWEIPCKDAQVNQSARPERAEWSAFLIEQILSHWSVISKATDIKEIIPDFDKLTKEQSAIMLAELLSCASKYECSWNPILTAKDVNGRSEKKYLATGLFQMNEIDQINYITETDYTHDELKNPLVNIEVAIKIIITVIKVRGKITFFSSERSPVLRYFFATLVKDSTLGKKVFADFKREYARLLQSFAIVQGPTQKNESALDDEIIEYLKKDIGQRETNGKNRSPLIDSICKFFGLPMGQPYCIGWILFRVDQCCKSKGLKNPIPKTMSTQEFWRLAPSEFKILKGNKAKKCCVGIQQQYANPSRGHAYLIIEDETDIQKTIEANTNPQGSRDGDGFYENVQSQIGDTSKKYLGAVDIVSWIKKENGL